MLKLMQRLARDQRGATAIEYGLIAALIVLTMIGGFIQVANSTISLWGNVNTKVESARPGP